MLCINIKFFGRHLRTRKERTCIGSCLIATATLFIVIFGVSINIIKMRNPGPVSYKMRKILICPDSFKGSLTAPEAAEAIAAGLRRRGLVAEIVTHPLSDGGEGILDIGAFAGNISRRVTTFDALGRLIEAEYRMDTTLNSAYIESARIVGLPLLGIEERNPLQASSMGLGMVIADACRSGCRDVYVMLGGSAVCDGGMGMLSALGVQFIDGSGNVLHGRGQNMQAIDSIKTVEDFARYSDVRFHAVCDVDNPLLGEYGAVNVFAPQKGADKQAMAILEHGMENFVEKSVTAGFGSHATAATAGAGAAGGLGYSMMAYLGAKPVKGIDMVLDITGFDKAVDGAEMIITGEGKLDRQSLMGKVVGGVLDRARRHNIPVVALAGFVEDKETLLTAGLTDIHEISDPTLTLVENMTKETAINNLIRRAEQLVTL